MHRETLTQTSFNTREVLAHKNVSHTSSSETQRPLTQINFYTEKSLHREACTRRNFYRQKSLRTEAFTHAHTRLRIAKLLHRETFAERNSYSEKLLHRKTFTHTHTPSSQTQPAFDTENLLQREAFARREAVKQKSFHIEQAVTQNFLHRDAFIQRSLCTEKLAYIYTASFCTAQLLHISRLLHTAGFYSQNLSHRDVFTVHRRRTLLKHFSKGS